MDRVRLSHQPHRCMHSSSRHSSSLQPRDETRQKEQDRRSVRAPIRVRMDPIHVGPTSALANNLEQTNPNIHHTSLPHITGAQKRRIQFRLCIRRSPHASRDVLQRPLCHIAFFINVPRISADGPFGAGRYGQDGQHVRQCFETEWNTTSNAAQWYWEREAHRAKSRRWSRSFRVDRTWSQRYVFGDHCRQGTEELTCER